MTDVRNWFVLAASERWREDKREHEHYSDSGGKSGGQKEKQLLIVTPLQKIHIIEPFVASVGFVHNLEGRDSRLRNLSIQEYREEKARVEAP